MVAKDIPLDCKVPQFGQVRSVDLTYNYFEKLLIFDTAVE